MPNFECPHCSQNIDAPDELAGADADCPACKGAIRVPNSTHTTPKESKPPETKKKIPASTAAKARKTYRPRPQAEAMPQGEEQTKKKFSYYIDKPSELIAMILLCIFFLWWNWNRDSASDIVMRTICYIVLLKSTVGIFKYHEEQN